MTPRRLFLKGSALAMIGAGTAPAWLGRALYAADSPASRKKTLVTIFQRGAVDGLNMIVPFGEPRYYELRPNLAIPKPDGTNDSAVDLDGFFGLHPALGPLKPIFDEGHLAIVEAAGSPDPTRSHFDAQDYMESGTPGLKATTGGWLGRVLAPARKQTHHGDLIRAVSAGVAMPRTLRGADEALAISALNDFQVRDPRSARAFERMYESSADSSLQPVGREMFEAVKLLQSIQKQTYTPANGARYPNGRFGQNMQQIARLIKADIGLEVAFAEMGGWDTHFNEVGARPTLGPLANLLGEFGQALAAFYQDLGDRMAEVSLVTMSEFGRTARENGSRGTDHGHANVMLAMGGKIRGGKVYGDWPGLEPEQLYEQRDLAVTTDFRDVLSEMVSSHWSQVDLRHVFPGYERPKFRDLVA